MENTLLPLFSQNDFRSIMFGISNLISNNEKFYFINHLKSLTIITKSLAEELELEEKQIQDLIFASILFCIILNNFPSKFQLVNPNEFENIEDKTSYFDSYFRFINVLLPIDNLKHYTQVLYQVWEYYNGTGLPNGIARYDLLLESQIISIAHNYLSRVYRIDQYQLERLTTKKKLTQKYDETLLRHQEALKFLQSNKTLYTINLLKAFMDLTKSDRCIALTPTDKDLVLEYHY